MSELVRYKLIYSKMSVSSNIITPNKLIAHSTESQSYLFYFTWNLTQLEFQLQSIYIILCRHCRRQCYHLYWCIMDVVHLYIFSVCFRLGDFYQISVYTSVVMYRCKFICLHCRFEPTARALLNGASCSHVPSTPAESRGLSYPNMLQSSSLHTTSSVNMDFRNFRLERQRYLSA